MTDCRTLFKNYDSGSCALAWVSKSSGNSCPLGSSEKIKSSPTTSTENKSSVSKVWSYVTPVFFPPWSFSLFETSFCSRFFFWGPQFRSARHSGNGCSILVGSQGRRQVSAASSGRPSGMLSIRRCRRRPHRLVLTPPESQRVQAPERSFC